MFDLNNRLILFLLIFDYEYESKEGSDHGSCREALC